MMEIGLGRHKKSKNKKIAGSEEKISSTITRHPYPNGLFFQSQLHLSVKTYNWVANLEDNHHKTHHMIIDICMIYFFDIL